MIHKNMNDKFLYLELDRKPGNALDICFLKELFGSLKDAEKEKGLAGVVIKSRNRGCFSSGLDIRSFHTAKGVQKRHLLLAIWYVRKIARMIQNSGMIYIAVLSGAVIGSAVTIAMACDIRLADRSVWLWLPDPVYGGLLADGGLDLIKSHAGLGKAAQICLTGQRVNVQEAVHMGIISEMVKEESVEQSLSDYQRKLMGYSGITIKETKALLNQNTIKFIPVWKLVKIVWSREMENRMLKLFENRSEGIRPDPKEEKET